MIAPTYLVLSLSALLPIDSSPLPTVREIEGFLTVTEMVDLPRVKKHAQLWAQELLTDKDKLTSLTAAQKIRELALLTSTLESLTNFTSPSAQDSQLNKDVYNKQKTWGDSIHEDSTWASNRLRRTKKNILGNLVHVITGLATDDQLQQQLKIDEVIRDKVANTLARQISFEQTMATIYSNLSREEETIHSMINSLQFQHDQDKAKHNRMSAYQTVVLEDIDRLEDQIEAVWTGHVNTRHAAFLSSRAGLSQVAAFTYIPTTHSANLLSNILLGCIPQHSLKKSCTSLAFFTWTPWTRPTCSTLPMTSTIPSLSWKSEEPRPTVLNVPSWCMPVRATTLWFRQVSSPAQRVTC
jgi:hypothetical protein